MKVSASYQLKVWLRTIVLWSAFLVMSPMVGCAPETVTVRAVPEFNPFTIQSIAIMPLQSLSTPQRAYQGRQNSSFQGGGMFEYSRSIEVNAPPTPDRGSNKTVTVPTYVPQKISHMIYTELKQRRGVRWISPEAVLQLEAVLRLNEGTQDSDDVKNISKRVGQRLSVDAVIQGLVRIYRERDGSRIAANPAAVGFDLQLIDSKTGDILWVGEFYEEQKPLTEDVQGFFERGGTFVTAEELAKSGVARLMNQFPIGVSPPSE